MQSIASTALEEYGIRWFDQEALFRAFSSEQRPQTFDDYARSLEPIARITGVEVNLLVNLLPRAGGNLAVTRALGDAHLKDPWFAINYQKDKVPYIHAIPEITIVKKRGHDTSPVIVMATDGVWEILDKEEVEQVVYEC
jgi:serine/threonine protein phosphatase PrpC